MDILNNQEQEQFEYRSNDDLAVLQYRIRNNTLYIMHTGVPKSMEGQGVGVALVKKVLAFVEEKQYDLKVYCPFARAYLIRHPELWPSSASPKNRPTE